MAGPTKIRTGIKMEQAEALKKLRKSKAEKLSGKYRPTYIIKPKELDTGKAQNQAEDDFGVPQGGPYAGVPYWNELINGKDGYDNSREFSGIPELITEEDADGNVKEDPDYRPRYGECECGAEKTYGKDATHSGWCTHWIS